MSQQEVSIDNVAPTTATPVLKHKVLPKARKQLMNEFRLKDSCLKLIDNQLGQEPYNMIHSRDGSKPSTRWSRTIDQIWTWNNSIPDEKGHRHFASTMVVDGHTFFRRDIYMEPVFRTDLHNLIRQQLRDKLGYTRCYVKPVSRTDYDSGIEHETLLIQVPV